MRLNKETLKESWLHISIIACFTAAIGLLIVLDYFNLEKIAFFNNIGFLFDYTWKGRLFLLFFFWLFILESFSDFKLLKGKLNDSRSKIEHIAIFAFALIPLAYIISINWLGFDQTVIQAGYAIRGDYLKETWRYWENSLNGDWPLSLEYVVFGASFLATTLLAYGKKALRIFAISIGLVIGIAVFYMIDTMFPSTAFQPFQVFALPTAACAAIVLQGIGIPFSMMYSTAYGAAPIISVTKDGLNVPTTVAWPCAGVHSLFLYTIIVLLLFKKSDISGLRKTIYFIIGAIGTYAVNVFRIVTYFVILLGQGQEPALVFHNVYGELYFFGWILAYIMLIVGIQKFKIVEKTRAVLFKKN
jgi:thaumarchaeosortase